MWFSFDTKKGLNVLGIYKLQLDEGLLQSPLFIPLFVCIMIPMYLYNQTQQC